VCCCALVNHTVDGVPVQHFYTAWFRPPTRCVCRWRQKLREKQPFRVEMEALGYQVDSIQKDLERLKHPAVLSS
jgi:hypothetical protein